MNVNQNIHVILGSGQLGQAVLRALVKQGESVRVVNRSGKAPVGVSVPAGPAVEFVAADLYQPEEVRRVTRGASVVYHTANAPYDQWNQKLPLLQASLIDGMTGSTAPLVMGDNLYMYGPVDGLISEDLPYAAKNRKGTTRARIAEMLLEAHRQGRLRAVFGRGSDFFGPGVTDSAAGTPMFGPLVKGKAANVLGSADVPHTYTFIDDFASALVVLGGCEEAWGQAWHVPNTETVTTRQFVQMAAEELGVEPKMMVAGPLMMRLIGLFMPNVRELVEMEYEFTQPYIVDDSKYKKAFGDHITPLRDAIRQTAVWFQQAAQQ